MRWTTCSQRGERLWWISAVALACFLDNSSSQANSRMLLQLTSRSPCWIKPANISWTILVLIPGNSPACHCILTALQMIQLLGWLGASLVSILKIMSAQPCDIHLNILMQAILFWPTLPPSKVYLSMAECIPMLNICSGDANSTSTDERLCRKYTIVRLDAGRLPFETGSLAAIHAGAALHCWPNPALAVSHTSNIQ